MKAVIIPLYLYPFIFAQAQQTDSTVIRTTSHLVQISVVVHEKGQPVEGLTKSDFTLLDQGKPRDITLFAASSARDNNDVKTAPLRPNTFSNYMQQQANQSSTVTIILFDMLNTPFADQAHARQALIQFVRELKPQDRIALYTLGHSLRILLDFTADAGEIARTLATIGSVQSLEVEARNSWDASGPGRPFSADPKPQVISNLDVASRLESDFYTESRAVATLRTFEAIANHATRIRGRKNLIWISAGFPLLLNVDQSSTLLSRSTFNEEVQRTARVINEANVAIYPIDARGLILNPGYGGQQSGNYTPPGLLRTPGISGDYTYGADPIDTMKELAARTGGHAFYNSQDIKGALRSAMDDSGVSYILGFYPDSDALDNKFHDIKVRVNRKGVDVRHRKGYFAFKDEPLNDEQRRRDLADALWSPLDSTAIPLRMQLERVDKPERGLLRAYLLADLHSLTVEQQNGHWSGGVDVLLVQQDKAGKILDSAIDSLNLDLDQENYDKLLKYGVPLGKFLRPKEALANVRAIVMDRPTGKIGSLIAPVSQVK